jgi:CRP-like cAMP-binding protein
LREEAVFMIGKALVSHLSAIGDLSREDADALRGISGEVRTLGKGREIFRKGDCPEVSVVVLEGLLARYETRADGGRQILSFYFPTDVPSLETLHIDYLDDDLGALVDSTVGLIRHKVLFGLMDEQPNLLHLIWRMTLVQGAICRQWMMRNSSLPAHARMAHLFCEIFNRAKAMGRSTGNSCLLPITQEILGNALGLSAVHVNRTLQVLRDSGLVEMKGSRLTIVDYDQLAEMAMFDPRYLHNRALAQEGPLVRPRRRGS